MRRPVSCRCLYCSFSDGYYGDSRCDCRRFKALQGHAGGQIFKAHGTIFIELERARRYARRIRVESPAHSVGSRGEKRR